jgi:hypothetical protein
MIHRITMVVISIAASVGSVILLYMLGRKCGKNDWGGVLVGAISCCFPPFSGFMER